LLSLIFSKILPAIFAFAIGMGIGSCVTLAYWRLPKGETVSGKWQGGKRAHCPSCNVKLRTRDLVPIFNWLVTRGHCHNCGVAINPVYFFIELSCALASLATYLAFGFSDSFFVIYGMCVCLILLAATDYSFRVFPDAILVTFIMFASLYRVLLDHQLLNMLEQFVFTVMLLVMAEQAYIKLFKREFYGIRYMKLLAAASLCLPLPAYADFLLVSFCLLPVTALFGQYGKKSHGIVLAAALTLHLFYPMVVWDVLGINPYI